MDLHWLTRSLPKTESGAQMKQIDTHLIPIEKIEIYADSAQSAVSLIYDLKGNVIGNSQHLAKVALKYAQVINQFKSVILKELGVDE